MMNHTFGLFNTKVFQLGDELAVKNGASMYAVIDEKPMKDLQKGETFLYFRSSGDKGVFTVDKRYEKTKPTGKEIAFAVLDARDAYAGYVERGYYYDVPILREVSEIDTSGKISCNACNERFKAINAGVLYEQKARQHVQEEHVDSDGNVSDEAIDALLERKA